MDCLQFEEIIDDLDRPGTQGLALRDAALNHAESCTRCAQLMTEAESLDFSLQLLGTHDADLEAPPRVEAVLLREWRRHESESRRKASPWRFAALAAAAIVLLAIGVLLRHENGFGRLSQTGATQVASTSAESTEVAQATDEEQSENSEDATDYVPLPGASDPATLEGGSIVRVVLSRSALLSLGLPVTGAGTGDRISADLVLSQDGAPQAIRLVSQTNGSE